MACVCPPGHPLAVQGILTTDMLKNYNLITSPPRRLPEEILQCHLKVMSSSAEQKRYFSDDTESILTLAKAGLGYTIYPDVTRAREPGLRYIPVEGFPRMSFGLYYRYDNDHPVMKRFLKMCEEAASE